MRRLMRGRLLVGFVAVAVLVPSVVLATHTFADVPDGTYYTAAVEWAGDTGVTSGTSATTFSPNAPVTRAQNVTFAYRYDQNVVQPALDAIRQSPERVVWVADDGTGDFLLLSTALASISDASVSNPYVVRIAPGEYTETATVALKTYVDVEGSGQGVTTITCACAGADYDASSATVSAGDIVAEIRHLTINNTGGDTRSYGVYTEDVVDGSVSMSDVTATATGASTYNASVVNYDSSPSMTNVTATATGGTDNRGVYNYSSSSPSIRNSSITGGDGSIRNTGTSSAQVADTMLDGTVTAGGGLACVGAYDETFSELDASCAP